MPDRLSGRASPTRPAWLEFLLVVALLAGAGVVGAFIWEWLWTAPVGVVIDHQWMAEDEAGLQGQFDSTGWYVVVASAVGLVGGLLAALFLDRWPLLTLAAILVGSAVGSFLMLRIGLALGPADPLALALDAVDGTRLAGELAVSERSPWVAMPAGALVGLALVFVGLTPRRGARMDDVHAG